MFCKNCGKELEENAKFCDGCGSNVNSVISSQKANFEDSDTIAKKSSNLARIVKLVIPIVVLLILLPIVIVKQDLTKSKYSKISEGMRILSSIASMQAASYAEDLRYISCSETSGKNVTATGAWKELGFDINPYSKYFTFEVWASGNEFVATATLKSDIGNAKRGESFSIDEGHFWRSGSTALRELVFHVNDNRSKYR
jgi:hypothetical protein